DLQHAVEVPIADQEASTRGLQCVLESSWHVEWRGRRIGQVELANVSHDGETVWSVHSVDSVHVAAADVRANEGDQCVRDVIDKRDIDRTTDERLTDADNCGRQTAGERRDFPSLRIDSRDSAGNAFGNVQSTVRADGAALGTLRARIQARN